MSGFIRFSRTLSCQETPAHYRVTNPSLGVLILAGRPRRGAVWRSSVWEYSLPPVRWNAPQGGGNRGAVGLVSRRAALPVPCSPPTTKTSQPGGRLTRAGPGHSRQGVTARGCGPARCRVMKHAGHLLQLYTFLARQSAAYKIYNSRRAENPGKPTV